MGGGKEGDVRQEFSNSSEQTSAPHRSDSGGDVFVAAGSVDRAAGKPPSSSAVPARRLTEIHPAVHDLFRAGYELLRAENQRLRTELGKTTKTTLERVKERRLEGWSNKKISEEEDIPYNTVAHYASVLIGRGEIDPISKRRESTVREGQYPQRAAEAIPFPLTEETEEQSKCQELTEEERAFLAELNRGI